MALSRQRMIEELLEVWTEQDPALKQQMAQYMIDTSERNRPASLPPIAWDFMRLGPDVRQRNFDAWFRRLCVFYITNRSMDWLRQQHKADVRSGAKFSSLVVS